MSLAKSEDEPSILSYFSDLTSFIIIAVALAIYVTVSLVFLQGDGIRSITDAVQQFIIGTIGCYLGIGLMNLLWDAVFR